MPIDFCASFEPFEKAIIAAETTCILRNLSFMKCGEKFAKSRKIMFMITIPVRKAIAGDAISPIKIFPIPTKFKPFVPTDIKTAPIKPPIKACDELDGRPIHHVSKFQVIAPISAAIIVFSSIMFAELTIPPPIVLATPVETIAPIKFKLAAIITA